MRHDSNIIKDIFYRYGKRLALLTQELPFFYISKEAEDGFLDYTLPVNEEGEYRIQQEYVLRLDDPEIKNILPFNHFCVYVLNLGWFNIMHVKTGEWLVTICLDENISELISKDVKGVLVNHLLTFESLKHEEKKTVPGDKIFYKTSNKVRIFTDKGHCNLNKDAIQRMAYLEESEEYSKEVTKSFGQNLEFIIAFFKWAETKHLVEVKNKPTKQDLKSEKHGNKKPWTRSDCPHYIYLDAPVTETDHPVNTKERKSVRGHHRRAHWYTLRHPRFKNHPKYMQQIRRKATWVGPKEWTVKNTIYTVHGED